MTTFNYKKKWKAGPLVFLAKFNAALSDLRYAAAGANHSLNVSSRFLKNGSVAACWPYLITMILPLSEQQD